MFANNEQLIQVQPAESWVFHFTFKTQGVKSWRPVPMNLASRFVVMHVKDVSGGVLASASTNCSNSAISNALCGIAILEFPVSATSSIPVGLYNYNLYVADLPILTSATYLKTVLDGPFGIGQT